MAFAVENTFRSPAENDGPATLGAVTVKSASGRGGLDRFSEPGRGGRAHGYGSQQRRRERHTASASVRREGWVREGRRGRRTK